MPGDFIALFAKKAALMGRIFGGYLGYFGDVSAKKSPLKGKKLGRGQGNGGVEKGYKKGP